MEKNPIPKVQFIRGYVKVEIMQRDPPLNIKKILREEVRFACPIPGCANPVLTWHHFDPPWNEKQHHCPEGMIALCVEHHRLADGNTWTKSELRSFKKKSHNIHEINKKFMWSESSIIYRLGGCYAANCGGIISISGIPILWDARSPDGRLLFSLKLQDQYGSTILFLDENCLSVETITLHDLSINTYENHLKLWLAERHIGLELRLKHLSIDKFSEQLNKDATEALKTIPEWVLSEMCYKPDNSLFMNYAKDNCLDTDNNITVLDICNAKLFGRGNPLLIRNGMVTGSGSGLQSCYSWNNKGGAFSF